MLALVTMAGFLPAEASTPSAVNQRYRAWGNNESGQLGDSATSGDLSTNSTPLTPSPDNAVWDQVEGGGQHTVARKHDGTVWAWGDNTFGQIGNNTTCTYNGAGTPSNCTFSTPQQVVFPNLPTGATITQVAAGYYHNLAIVKTTTGATNVWAWGYNNSGQLGDGTNIDRHAAVPISGTTGVNEIGSGFSHSLAILAGVSGAQNQAWAWGENYDGELGNGVSGVASTSSPVRVKLGTGFLNDVTKLTGGNGHSLALQLQGNGTKAAYSWGLNAYGELCQGNTTSLNTATQINPQGTLTDIEAGGGGLHTLLLKSNSTMKACGNNEFGQLGDGCTIGSTCTNQLSPTNVKDAGGTGLLSNIVGIAGCGKASMAIVSGGTVMAWGQNDHGQLGDGTTTNRSLPVAVGGSLSAVTQVSCGYTHTLALRS